MSPDSYVTIGKSLANAVFVSSSGLSSMSQGARQDTDAVISSPSSKPLGLEMLSLGAYCAP